MTAYAWRQHKENRRIVPTLWLSPAELFARDIELYEPAEGSKFDQKFIEDFAKARDETLALIKKQSIVSLVIFAFLLASYTSIGVDISIAGISLKNTPGVPEALLLITNLLSCYNLVLQGNCYLIESAMKLAIASAFPEQLQPIYRIRYFPHEITGRYYAVSLPHITQTKLVSRLTGAIIWLFFPLLVIGTIAFIATNLYLLFHFLWLRPNFGAWSYALLAYILACGVFSFLYMLLSRIRVPYRDFTVNHELEILQQINPEQHRIRGQQIFGRLNEYRDEMERRGYIKKRD